MDSDEENLEIVETKTITVPYHAVDETTFIKNTADIFLWKGDDTEIFWAQRDPESESPKTITWFKERENILSSKSSKFTTKCKEESYFSYPSEENDFWKEILREGTKLDCSCTEKFIQWQKVQLLNSSDVLYASQFFGNNDKDLYSIKTFKLMNFRNRIYFQHYRPKDLKAVGVTPIFVVLNGAPLGTAYTRNLCTVIGKSFECLSIDCISRSFHTNFYGDTKYAEEETKRLNVINREYRASEMTHEMQAVANAIIRHLEDSTQLRSRISERQIIILSNFYTSHYATVLAGSEVLRKYNSNVSCIYFSESALPFKRSLEDVQEDLVDSFCKATEDIAKYGDGIKLNVDAYIQTIHNNSRVFRENIRMEELQFSVTRGSNGINVRKNYKTIDITTPLDLKTRGLLIAHQDDYNDKEVTELNELFFDKKQMSVLGNKVFQYITSYGCPEKACYMVSKCRSFTDFENVYQSISMQHKSQIAMIENHFAELHGMDRKTAINLGLQKETMQDEDLERPFKKVLFISYDPSMPRLDDDPNLDFAYFMDQIKFVPKYIGWKEMNQYPSKVLNQILNDIKQHSL